MSKGSNGSFKGTNGAKNAGGGSAPPLFDNGHVTYESIAANREEFMGKSVEQIGDLLKRNGYEFNTRGSKNKGSTAKILEITNPSKERDIKQVQVSSDGSRRHGGIPYVKISTSNAGKIKIIDGKREEYKTDGSENATLIFRRDNDD